MGSIDFETELLAEVRALRAVVTKTQEDHEVRIAGLERKSTIKTAVVSGLTSVIVAAITAAASGCALPSEVPEPLPVRAAGGTVLLTIKEDGALRGRATAWYAAPHVLVTAGHACRPEWTYEVSNDWGVDEPAVLLADLGGDNPFESVTDPDAPPDLCALGTRSAGRPLPLGSADNLRFGDELAYAGYPGGHRTWYAGTYGYTHDEGALMVAVPAWPGASGSAILDASGRVVGVLVEGANPAGTQIWAEPVEGVRALLADLAPFHPDAEETP